MKLSLSRMRSICGLLAVVGIIAFLAITLLAMNSYPGYSIFSNYLSDLGVGPSAWLFNGGLLLAGLLSIGLGAAFFLKLGNLAGKLGGALLAVASVALASLGVFTEASEPAHVILASAFFLFSALALFLIGRNMGIALKSYSILAGLLSLAFLLLQSPLAEHAAALAVAVWMFAAGAMLINMKSEL